MPTLVNMLINAIVATAGGQRWLLSAANRLDLG